MKTIEIEVIAEPNISRVNNSQGGYDVAEIAFKDGGKVSGKKLNSYFQKEIFPIVRELKRGDHLEVDLEKETGSDGKEYWQWKSVRKLSGEPAPSSSGHPEGADKIAESPTSEGTTRGRSGVGKVTGSNYETAEERALRQVLIVRQSSASLAQAYHTTREQNDQVPYSLADLLATADVVAEWVFDGGRLNPPALNVPEDGLDIPVAITAAKEGEVKPTIRRKKAGKAVAEIEDDIPF